MFSDELKKISWKETSDKILSKNHVDVEEALNKEMLNVDDFMALVSPAAIPILSPWLVNLNFTPKKDSGRR